jgi:DegV family protein with EDD domain
MKTLPTTATAAPGRYVELYDRLLQRSEAVISVHASSKLSGIHNAASAAAQSFPGRVTVFDSLNISMGLGHLAILAAEAAARGEPAAEILGRLERLRSAVRLIAVLDTLEFVRRSGRVSWAKAQIGTLLKFKPFVEIRDGLVHSLGETRTHHKGVERLKELLVGLGPLQRLAMLHTNAEAEARQILSDLDLSLPTPPEVVSVTTVIGTHVGPNTLGFAALLAT